ncbi:hypothetical protein EDI_063850 [Entamoeba dispar SAW760]|uniref:Uncharacterized protein n=1 Tax=Entamoeba dispar (strain ATCC PRA-260 / SAW760) TaxID=370354 RepID=B0EQQ5_ENTDS|nr:uncharacterized protein EDI_063850 [Entamoeba dispar SAW760]EDR23136.1 hypothetical protein EDI_063850 [Entamoeba dispar SAW760]|eukprot:EDR23136.1 hypothetical protein EDI_063850 [Entamoeba dispar SAW760]
MEKKDNIEKTLMSIIENIKKNRKLVDQNISNLSIVFNIIRENIENINGENVETIIKETIKTIDNNKEVEQLNVIGIAICTYCLPVIKKEKIINLIVDYVKTFPNEFETEALISLTIVIYEFMIMTGNKTINKQYYFGYSNMVLNKYSTNEDIVEYSMRLLCRIIKGDGVLITNIVDKQIWTMLMTISGKYYNNNQIQKYLLRILNQIISNLTIKENKELIIQYYLNRIKESEGEIKELLYNGIYYCTKQSINNNDFINSILQIIGEELKEDKENNSIIISNCFGILNNLQEQQIDIFIISTIIDNIIQLTLKYMNDIVIQKYGIHLIRLSSFNDKFHSNESLLSLRESITLYKTENQILEDTCVICYNLYLNEENIEKKENIKTLVNLIKETNSTNKIIYAIWYALSNHLTLNFVH